MKIRLGDLRVMIREVSDWKSNVLPPEVDAVMKEMIVTVMSDEDVVEREVMIDNKRFRVGLRKTAMGFQGTVDNVTFGEGKRPGTALNGVKRRLKYLMSNLGYAEYDPEKIASASATADYAELKKREKSGW